MTKLTAGLLFISFLIVIHLLFLLFTYIQYKHMKVGDKIYVYDYRKDEVIEDYIVYIKDGVIYTVKKRKFTFWDYLTNKIL